MRQADAEHHEARSVTCTRRQVLQGLVAALTPGAWARVTPAQYGAQSGVAMRPEPLSSSTLPSGIRSRFAENVNGLRVHVLEAGWAEGDRPCVLLLHGFPELAYSWRKVMGPLAAAGFHVLAPDLRGYGRTTGWDDRYEADLRPFGLLNYVRDALALVSAFGYRSVAAIVGHDFGSVVAPWCPLVRPDVFHSVVLMSAPFAGPPSLPFDTVDAVPRLSRSAEDLDAALATLSPPRKQYRKYYSTREANADMMRALTAGEFAKLPTYYVMELNKTMPESVAPAMPTAAEIAACQWLPDEDLRVYTGEYGRTGFQGGLDGYRVRLTDAHNAELQLFAGRTVDVPSMFIGGRSDWGVYQTPGAFESMQRTACTRMEAVHLVDSAGHWVQQEQPEAVSRLLLQFLQTRH